VFRFRVGASSTLVRDRRRRLVGMGSVLDFESAAMDIIDAFADIDTAALATLDASGRNEQLHARQALDDYIDRLWEDANARRLYRTHEAEWKIITCLRDVTNALREQAAQAQLDADEVAKM
jgi:hypothetical protein